MQFLGGSEPRLVISCGIQCRAHKAQASTGKLKFEENLPIYDKQATRSCSHTIQQTSHPVQFLVGSKPRFVISCDIPCQAREAQATYNARFPMQFMGSEPSYRKLKSKKICLSRVNKPPPLQLGKLHAMQTHRSRLKQPTTQAL